MSSAFTLYFKKMSAIIAYNCFNGIEMSKYNLDLNTIIPFLPRNKTCHINTNIKRHCDYYTKEKEFVIDVKNGKITNTQVLREIEKYLQKNNARSFFYEGLVSNGNNKYSLMWSS